MKRMLSYIKKTWWWFIDYLNMFNGYIQPLVGNSTPDHYKESMRDQTIILIPGLFTSWHFLKKIGNYFSKQGYSVHVVATISYNKDSIEKESQKLHNYLERNNLINVIIIAHSKGGLIGKHYMEDQNTADHRVIRLIALATPFSGSRIAQMIPIKTMSELGSDSRVIQGLSSHDRSHLQITSIFPSWDNHILHKNKSYLEGAKNIEVDIPGHHRLLFDARILRIIEQEL